MRMVVEHSTFKEYSVLAHALCLKNGKILDWCLLAIASVFYSFLENEGRRWRRFKRCKWNSERAANIINEQHEQLNGRTNWKERWHKTWSCDAYRCGNWILRLSLRRKLFSLNIEYFLEEVCLRVSVCTDFFSHFSHVSFPSFHVKIEIGCCKKIELLWYRFEEVTATAANKYKWKGGMDKPQEKTEEERKWNQKKLATNCFSMPVVVLHMPWSVCYWIAYVYSVPCNWLLPETSKMEWTYLKNTRIIHINTIYERKNLFWSSLDG